MSRWVEDRLDDFGKGVADSLGAVLKEENWHLHGNYSQASQSTESGGEEEDGSARATYEDDSSDDSSNDDSPHASSTKSEEADTAYSPSEPSAETTPARKSGESVIGRVIGTAAVGVGLLLVAAAIFGDTTKDRK